jgi:hypothetical protein
MTTVSIVHVWSKTRSWFAVCKPPTQTMHLPSILLWGFAATMTLTTLVIAGQSLGLTRLDMPFIVGTMFTANRDRAKVVGYLVHVINGWLFAFAYALFFMSVEQASWWFGGLMGAMQGVIVVVVVLPLLPGVHPRMVSDFRGPQPTRLLEPPGFLAVNYGRATPLLTIAAHAVYGMIIGAFY